MNYVHVLSSDGINVAIPAHTTYDRKRGFTTTTENGMRLTFIFPQGYQSTFRASVLLQVNGAFVARPSAR